MKLSQKITAALGIIFGIITICLAVLSLLRYFKTDTTMIFAGLSQLFLGLNLIIRGQNIDPKGKGKENKRNGMISLIAGGIILGLFVVEKIV